ncbi:MAG TPA: hypothetical protein PLS95_16305 [Thermoanaerobaculales bacterium]|nr:hypothetical protein [Thermoanaerobaculales bacterium]
MLVRVLEGSQDDYRALVSLERAHRREVGGGVGLFDFDHERAPGVDAREGDRIGQSHDRLRGNLPRESRSQQLDGEALPTAGRDDDPVAVPLAIAHRGTGDLEDASCSRGSAGSFVALERRQGWKLAERRHRRAAGRTEDLVGLEFNEIREELPERGPITPPAGRVALAVQEADLVLERLRRRLLTLDLFPSLLLPFGEQADRRLGVRARLLLEPRVPRHP